MSRGQNPLIWMVAISLPSAGHALGLGEIHVDSALNEPLAAEIDIVGATPEELAGLTAKVAGRETFARFNVDRPSFLSTTTFKVAQDAHGRPVLAVRSQESFTEPLVNFVIDLHWHNGELVRQYTLLLDPAGYQMSTRLAQEAPITASPTATVTVGSRPTAPSVPAAAPVAAAEPSEPVSQASSGETTESTVPAPSTRKLTHVKVGAKATLRGVAWRVGARSDIDIKRTMLAIYRANPTAFEGNINIMHLGALLTIPAREVIEAIDQAEARREVHRQMAAWRAAPKGGIPTRTPRPAVAAAPAPKPAEAPAPATPVAVAPTPTTVSKLPAATPPVKQAPAATPAPQSPAAAAEAEELTQRIKTLEQSLRDVQAQIEREHNNLLNMQAQARYAEQQAAASAAAPQAKPAETQRSYWGWVLAAGAALAGLVGAYFLRGRKSPGRASRASDTPIMPFGEAAREISAKLQPPAAPEPLRASPEASVNVRKGTARPSEPRIELSQMQHEPSSVQNHEEAVDTVEVETPENLKAAQLAEDEATVRLREELALAWSIPAAEDYRRTDNEEHSLADAIAKSLADTAKLRALKAEEETKPEEYSGEETIVTGTHTVIVDPSETAMLPAATVNLSAESLQKTELMPGIPESQSAQTQPLEQLDETHIETAQAEAASPASASIDSKNLDYNLLDLDQTQQHVHMPSMLHENVVVKERRTNLVDVLKMAIEREPERRDLRMKLLETYYAAAATNRQAFLEAVDKITADGRNLKESDWERINQMGRQIASDSELFEEGKTGGDDEDLADCA